jgi:hypothetical protein
VASVRQATPICLLPSRTCRPSCWRNRAISTHHPAPAPTTPRRHPSTSSVSPNTMAATIQSPGCTKESCSFALTERQMTRRFGRRCSTSRVPPASGTTLGRRTKGPPLLAQVRRGHQQEVRPSPA